MTSDAVLNTAGEFGDAVREAEYQTSRFAETVRHARLIMIASFGINALFFLSDLRFLGNSHIFVAVPARAVIVAASLIGWVLARRIGSFAGLESMLIAWSGVVALASAALTTSRSDISLLVLFVLPSIYYLALPLSFRWTVLTGAGCSFSVVAAYLFSGPVPDTAVGIALSVVALNISLGLVVHRAHRLRRLEWASAQAERRAREELAKNRAMLERMFMAVPIPLVLVTRDEGRLIKANDAAWVFYGSQFTGDNGSVRPLYVDLKDRDRLLAAIEKDGRVEDFETRFRIADGSFRDVLLSASVIDFEGVPCLVTGATDITSRKAVESHLQRLATTDPLTGLVNRTRFYSIARNEIQRAIRYDRPLAVAMIDIDHFKRINDSHGHEVGDLVLRGFAGLCRKILRQQDVAARMGGEEFALLLPETLPEHGLALAERIRAETEAMRIDQPPATVQITISIGVASVTSGETEPDAALVRADQALYAAKRGGRNRVVDFSAIASLE